METKPRQNRWIIVWLAVLTLILLWDLSLRLTPAIRAEGTAPLSNIGRYQITCWAAQSGRGYHHSGYYILDTTTGKIVDQGREAHGPGE